MDYQQLIEHYDEMAEYYRNLDFQNLAGEFTICANTIRTLVRLLDEAKNPPSLSVNDNQG